MIDVAWWRQRLTAFELQWHHYALAVSVGSFVTFNVWWLAPRLSDGYVYMYLGSRVLDGALLYRDIFYSSPPLLPYITALIGSVFGWHWYVFGLVPIALSIIDAGILYSLVRSRTRAVLGVTAATLYLFSYTVLATTDFATGVHFVVTFSLAGLWCLHYKRFGWAGIFLAAAVLIKLYAIVLFVSLVAAVLAQRQWRGVLRLVLIFSLVVGSLGLLFWLLAGDALLQQVVVNNLGRGVGIPRDRLLRFLATHDWWIFVALGAAAFWRRHLPWLWFFPVVGLGLFYGVYLDLYYLYFKMLVAWLTLWFAWLIWQGEARWPRRAVEVGGLVFVLVVTGSSVYRYLHEQSVAAVITHLAPMVEYIEATTDADALLYGSYDITPLLALMTDRLLFEDLADTNTKFFSNGGFDFEERAAAVLDNKVSLIITKGIVSPSGTLESLDQVLPVTSLQQECRLGQIFPLEHDYSHNAIIVWRCG